MIIDARNFVGFEYGRPGSLKAAMNHALAQIEAGNHIHVEGMKDSIGKNVPWERLNVYVSMLKGNRTFKVRKSVHGIGYEVHRVA